MPITTDDSVPQEMVDLLVAFTKCAEGHEAIVVINATINLAVATINMIGKEKGYSLQETVRMANNVAKLMILDVAENYDREPQPTDRPATLKTS